LYTEQQLKKFRKEYVQPVKLRWIELSEEKWLVNYFI
jgi:hypothetical protein